MDVYVDRLIAPEGRELFNVWMFSGFLESQWAYLNMEHCVPGLGDAGAHAGYLSDADSPTFMLAELTRKRGVLHEGWVADLNIIAYEKLGCGYPEYVNDFPHNGGRFIFEGYRVRLFANLCADKVRRG